MASKTPTFDFMGKRLLATILSAVLVIGSIVLLATNGLNWGLDFTGGTLVEVAFAEPTSPQTVRDELDAAGYENGVVQNFGTERDLSLIHI